MSVKVENNKILVEFSLTLPKRAWKIRKRSGRKPSPNFGYVIEKEDLFEWMLTNNEVRDMLLALKYVSKQSYNDMKEFIYHMHEGDFVDWQTQEKVEGELGYGIILEGSRLPKQWKPTELTPYLFILFPLDNCSDFHSVIDINGNNVKKTLGYKLKSGDRLIWTAKPEWLKKVAFRLASLDSAHLEMVKSEILTKIDALAGS